MILLDYEKPKDDEKSFESTKHYEFEILSEFEKSLNDGKSCDSVKIKDLMN